MLVENSFGILYRANIFKFVSAERFNTCYCFGDTHCRTFDGKMLSYQGVCKFLLVRSKIPVYAFDIYVENNEQGSIQAVEIRQDVHVIGMKNGKPSDVQVTVSN